MDSPDGPLQRLVEAAKSAPSSETKTTPLTEIRPLKDRIRATLLTLTWRRLSLFGAIVAGIAFIIFYFIIRDDEPLHPAHPSPEFPETP